MTSTNNRSAAPPRVSAVTRFLLGPAFAVACFAAGGAQAQAPAQPSAPAAPQAQAQPTDGPTYGVTALDVRPGNAQKGIALLKHYRDAASKQAGNHGVLLLQELDMPNRFVIYEAWADHAAFEANESAAQTAELRDKLKAISVSPYDRRDFRVISVASPLPPPRKGAVYLHLHLDVFPPGIDATLAAEKVVAEAARRAPGNLGFEATKSLNPPLSHTTVIGMWKDKKAFDAYEASDYGKQFRNTVGPLLGSPYDDRLYKAID